MAQLRRRKFELEILGAELYCILPMDRYRSATFKKKTAGPYTTLSDPAGRACSIYGVYRQLVVARGECVNAPATVIIDLDGVVRYRYVGKDEFDRPSAETIIREIKKIVPTPDGKRGPRGETGPRFFMRHLSTKPVPVDGSKVKQVPVGR